MAQNPSPDHISPALWAFQERAVAVTGGEQSGVYANKPGYHNARDQLPVTDYSRADVAADREGLGRWAAATDIKMDDRAGMIRHTARLDQAAAVRDPRLYPPGAPPVLREFIGTLDGVLPYCYVLTGGRQLGLPSDASEDWRRDDSHLWHLHLSIIRRYAANADALDGVLSVLSGEPLDTWRRRHQPRPVEDDMTQSLPIPTEFAYSAGGVVVARKFIVTAGTEPAGYAPNAIVGSQRLYLGLVCDHSGDENVVIRYAVFDGKGWFARIVTVNARDGRLALEVPAARGPNAYGISAGRLPSRIDAPPSEATIPCSLVITVA